MKRIYAISCICLFMLLAGCAEQLVFKDIPILEDVEKFLAEQMQPELNEQKKNVQENTTENKSPPKPGDMISIHQHNSEVIYEVSVEKTFHAASGRLCIYFFEPGKQKAKDPTGLACLNDDQRWIAIPLKVIKST
jgi:hypothetical protein